MPWHPEGIFFVFVMFCIFFVVSMHLAPGLTDLEFVGAHGGPCVFLEMAHAKFLAVLFEFLRSAKSRNQVMSTSEGN